MDGFMNVVLEQAEEYEGGELQAKYGDAFVRGNNGEGFIDLFRRAHVSCRESHATNQLPFDLISTVHSFVHQQENMICK